MYAIELFRVNPVTRCCDGSGRKSSFYSNSKLNLISCRARKALKLGYSDFCDFDNDVYLIKIINLKTQKEHLIV